MRRGVLTIAVAIFAIGTQLATAAKLGPVVVHGFASQGYIDSANNNFIPDSEDGTFAFREYGVNAIVSPLKRLRIGAQMYAREFGPSGNDAIQLDWALADLSLTEWLGVRAGKLKLPYGLYNQTRDIDALRTEILLPQGVYPEYQREPWNALVGAGVYGEISLAEFGGLDYEVQFGERSLDPDDGDMARVLQNIGTTPDDYDMEAGIAASLVWNTPLEGLRLGTTYAEHDFVTEATASSPMGDMAVTIDTRDQESFSVSAEYTAGELLVAAEYASTSFDATIEFGSPFVPTQELTPSYQGYYVRAGYGFIDWLTGAAGYSHFESNEDADGEQNDIYVSVRFDVSENFILKLEQHFTEGTLGVFEEENPDGVDDNTRVFLAKASIVF